MNVFPFYCDITETRFLVIGGGKVAAGKISRLTDFTDRITVVAPKVDASILRLAEEGRLTVVKRCFQDSDLEGCGCVIAAAGNRALSRHVSALCRQRHILVNAVDDPENCTFFFPAIIKRGRLPVGISTGGASPACAALLKRRIEEVIPENIEEILDRMQEVRHSFPEEYPDFDQHRRAAVYRRLLEELIEVEQIPGPAETEQMIQEICRELSSGQEPQESARESKDF